MRWLQLPARPSVLTVAVVLLLLPSRPPSVRGRPVGVSRRGADDGHADEEEEHRKMSKAMVRNHFSEAGRFETNIGIRIAVDWDSSANSG